MPTTGPNAGMIHSYASRESGWNVGMDANLKKIDALMGGGVAAVFGATGAKRSGERISPRVRTGKRGRPR